MWWEREKTLKTGDRIKTFFSTRLMMTFFSGLWSSFLFSVEYLHIKLRIVFNRKAHRKWSMKLRRKSGERMFWVSWILSGKDQNFLLETFINIQWSEDGDVRTLIKMFSWYSFVCVNFSSCEWRKQQKATNKKKPYKCQSFFNYSF